MRRQPYPNEYPNKFIVFVCVYLFYVFISHGAYPVYMSQLTLFDFMTRNKRPRTESTDYASATSCKTTADLEVCSPNNLELADSIDVDTTVSSPIWIDSDSNEGLSTPLSLSSSLHVVSEELDACTPVTTTPSTQSAAGSKTFTAVSPTTRAGVIAQSPAFPPVQPKHVRFPTTTYSNRIRSFNPTWYDTYDWQLNEMLVFAIRAACLTHKVVASLVGQSQHSLSLALKIGNMRQVKTAF